MTKLQLVDKLVLLFKDYNVNLNYLLGGIGSEFNSKTTIDDEFTAKVKTILKNEGLIK